MHNPHRPGRTPAGRAAARGGARSRIARGRAGHGHRRLGAGARGRLRRRGLQTPAGVISTEGVPPSRRARHGRADGPSVADCALAWSVLSGEPVPEPRLDDKRIGKLTHLPSLGEAADPAPRDPRTDDLPGEEVELPVPRADVWPVFYGGAADSHRATYPARADEYGPSIRAKLERAMSTTAEDVGRAREAMETWQRVAAQEPAVDVIVSPVLGLPELPSIEYARARLPDPVLGLRAPVQLPRLARDRDRRDAAGRARPAHAARSGARVGSVGATGSLRCMVEGPAVTLDDDHAPAVRIDALEMFVELLASVEADGASDDFYGPLCEATCAWPTWTAR